jgi:MarR family transcriptional regulator, lower aerobic nicotinate degradation pathway regulator
VLPAALNPRFGFLAAKVAELCAEVFIAELEPLNVSIRAAGILIMLAEGGSQSQFDVGRQLRLERSTLTNAIDELERAGHLTRQRHPSDRRLNALELTESGRHASQLAKRASERTAEKLLNPLPASRRAQMIRDLQRILANAAPSKI